MQIESAAVFGVEVAKTPDIVLAGIVDDRFPDDPQRPWMKAFTADPSPEAMRAIRHPSLVHPLPFSGVH